MRELCLRPINILIKFLIVLLDIVYANEKAKHQKIKIKRKENHLKKKNTLGYKQFAARLILIRQNKILNYSSIV